MAVFWVLSAAFTVAPASSSARAASAEPMKAAPMRGVMFRRLGLLESAPRASSSLTVSA